MSPDLRYEEAERLRKSGALEQSADLFATLLEEYFPRYDEGIDTTSADAFVVERCAEFAELFGDLDTAGQLFEHLRTVYARFGNLFAHDFASLRLMRVLTSLGDCSQAEATLEALCCKPGAIATIEFTRAGLQRFEGCLTWPGVPEPDRAQMLLLVWKEVGRCRAFRGSYRDAVQAFERSLHHCGDDSASSLYAHRSSVHVELAATHFEAGDCTPARETLALVPEDHPDPALRVRGLEILARIDMLEGFPSRAVKKLETATSLCHAARRAEAEATEALNLVALLISLNQLNRARTILESIDPAIAGENGAKRIAALRQLAEDRAGPVSHARESAASATEMWSKWKAPARHENESAPFINPLSPDGFLATFEARTLTFYALLGNETCAAAASELNAISTEFGDTDSRLIRARLTYFGGLVAYYQKKFSAARRLHAESSAAFHQMGNLFDRWQSLKALSWACFRDGDAEESRRQRDLSDEILERIAGSFSAADRAIFLLNKWPEEEEHLSRELRKAYAARTGFRKRLQLLRRLDFAMRYIDAHRLLIAERQGLKARFEGYVSGIENFRRTFEYPVLRLVVLPDRIVSIRINGWHADILESPLNRVGIRSLVAAFHSNVQDARDAEKREQAQACLQQIAEAIQLGELVQDLKPDSELRLLPDDCLHGVPFAALPLPDGTMFGEKYALSIGSQWQSRPPEPASRPSTALLLGLSYEDCGKWKRLPGAVAEADLLEKTPPFVGIKDARLAEESVTLDRVRRCLPAAEYVHIACHGVFYPDDPSASGIVIATEDHPGGILSIADLGALDLSRVRHLALSSCWGADDYASPGRHIISLPETLVRSGVRTVLGCLWPVTDVAAQELLPAYYENLATLTPARALHKAQKSLSDKTIFKPYYYWAGYRVYTGD